MRQHKYRIWDNLKKEWLKKKVYHSSITLDANGIGEFSFKQHPEGYTIQQYTGLKDKNGNEIYEGDILFFQQQDGVWPNQLNKHIEVKYPFVCGNTHLGEIIGNIFEHPDLLK